MTTDQDRGPEAHDATWFKLGYAVGQLDRMRQDALTACRQVDQALRLQAPIEESVAQIKKAMDQLARDVEISIAVEKDVDRAYAEHMEKHR